MWRHPEHTAVPVSSEEVKVGDQYILETDLTTCTYDEEQIDTMHKIISGDLLAVVSAAGNRHIFPAGTTVEVCHSRSSQDYIIVKVVGLTDEAGKEIYFSTTSEVLSGWTNADLSILVTSLYGSR